MSREYLRTPDEFVAAEFARVMMLFGQALPSETDREAFERHMNEASAKGLNWVEGLEYAAAKRQAEPKRLLGGMALKPQSPANRAAI